MTRLFPGLIALNRGLISPLALARTDISRTALSFETYTNYMPRVLGSAMMRPGLKYLTSTHTDAAAKFLPFVFEIDDKALLEFTDSVMRIWIDDAPIERAAVTSSITNGEFTSNITSWTDDSETGATASWVTGGYAGLLGDGKNAALLTQQISGVPAGEQATEHAVRVTIARGPVFLKIGTTSGADDLFAETSLDEGVHSLTFTPNAASFFIQVGNRRSFTSHLDSITIESSGIVTIPTPYAAADLQSLRAAQSRDRTFLACFGHQQRKILRRDTRSWSISKYLPEDGPLRTANVTDVTLTPGALSGDTTLTASNALFRSGHVGAIFRVSSSGQAVETAVSAQDTFTSPGVRVTGVTDDRQFTVTVSAGTASTVTLQKAVGQDDTSLYTDVQTLAAGSTTTIDDGLDNQIIFYRVGVKTGDYVDPVTVGITYARGSIDGYGRVNSVASTTVANISVLSNFGGTDPTVLWSEGAWSDLRGYPSAVELFDGRLWWAGKGSLWGSVSDAFTTFDDTVEGDSGPITKTISVGPSDRVPWLVSSSHMMMGTTGGEFIARSSSLDEPLTPTASSLRRFSSGGAANVEALVIDTRAYYVQRSETEVYEATIRENDYLPTPVRLSDVVPEIGEPGLVRIAGQHQPDTRAHFVRADGKVAVLVTDPAEGVKCWLLVETDGFVEDVVVLPDTTEDAVYYVVRRTIGGVTKRYLERWALESEARGATVNKIADSHVVYSGGATNIISGLSHLEGKTVVVWADGTPRDSTVVSGGTVNVSGDPATDIVAGLGYTGRLKSTKLVYGTTGAMTMLTKPRRVNDLAFILRDFHVDAISFGPSFDLLDAMPRIDADYAPVVDGTVETYDQCTIPFDGEWDSDSRVCVETQAPYPVTILAMAIDVDTPDRYRNTSRGTV